MSVDRKKMGLSNKKNGARWEAIIAKSLETLYSDICVCEKTPEPFHMLGYVNKHMIKGYYEKKGQPDFKGVLKGGRCICFEAKFTSTDRIRYNCVTSLQEETLDKYSKLGAVCFVMVCFDFKLYCKIPWEDWKNMKQLFGHKYISSDEAEKYALKTENDLIFLLAE